MTQDAVNSAANATETKDHGMTICCICNPILQVSPHLCKQHKAEARALAAGSAACSEMLPRISISLPARNVYDGKQKARLRCGSGPILSL
jgi:alpha-beta hydrolase superfamily lysophospholipase